MGLGCICCNNECGQFFRRNMDIERSEVTRCVQSSQDILLVLDRLFIRKELDLSQLAIAQDQMVGYIGHSFSKSLQSTEESDSIDGMTLKDACIFSPSCNSLKSNGRACSGCKGVVSVDLIAGAETSRWNVVHHLGDGVQVDLIAGAETSRWNVVHHLGDGVQVESLKDARKYFASPSYFAVPNWSFGKASILVQEVPDQYPTRMLPARETVSASELPESVLHNLLLIHQESQQEEERQV